MTAIERLLNIAEAEVGYLETDKGENIDYIKYARDLFKGNDPGQWCDLFVDWCFLTAFGMEATKILLCDYFGPFITYSAAYYKEKGLYFDKPQIGDVVFFHKDKQICHAGIVYKIDESMIYTIEGDTFAEPGVRDEGVYKKMHRLVSSDIDGYMRPNWSMMPDNVGLSGDYDRQVVFDLQENYCFNQKNEILDACMEQVIAV